MRSGRLRAWPWLAILAVSSTMQDISKISSATAARVSCEIRTQRNDAGARLDAVIRATGTVSGTFEFKVRNRANGETTSQSGDFAIDSASPTEIKKASLALARGEAYDATLAVKWPNGASSCSASGH